MLGCGSWSVKHKKYCCVKFVLSGSTVRVDYLASLLKTGGYAAFKAYASNLAESMHRSNPQSHEKVLEAVLAVLWEDDESDIIASDVLDNAEKDWNSIKQAKAIVNTFSHIHKSKLAEMIKQLRGGKELAIGGLGDRSVATVALVAAQLGYDVISNMHRWWMGEISGRRCAKNIFDSLGTTVGELNYHFCGINCNFETRSKSK